MTNNVANVNHGSTDAAALDPIAFPILPGANSFEKWLRLHVTAMGGSAKIDNLKIWRTGALGANATHKTNARESAYGGADAYATPVAAASSVATQTMPSATPTGANLGIGGSLTGSLTAAGYSDYLVSQVQTTGAATAGSTTTQNFQYDETA